MATIMDLFGVLHLINKSQRFNYRIRLQKMILIAKLDNKINYDFSFEFLRHHYGPYSFELNSLVSQLVSDGALIEHGPGGGYSYELSKFGMDVLESIEQKVDLGAKEKIDKLWDEHRYVGNKSLIEKAKELYGW